MYILSAVISIFGGAAGLPDLAEIIAGMEKKGDDGVE
jgi:hypothetical protein